MNEYEQERADREATLDGLREMERFLREHPNVPLPLTSLYAYRSDPDDVRAATHLTGEWSKAYADAYVYYRKSFAGDVCLTIASGRPASCVARVVGKRTIPAAESYEVDIVEWDCGPGSK